MTFSGVLVMLIIGLVVGALAKLIMPGKDPGGIVVTILLGIGGSLLAGFVGRQLGWYGHGRAPGIIGSILGAIVILALYRVVVGRRRVV